MNYSIHQIAHILEGQAVLPHPNSPIEHLSIDSRKIVFPETALFFAIKGPRRDGHLFVEEVYALGVRNFVVSEGFTIDNLQDANFILVEDVLAALQQITAYHRLQFHIPIIGITGSNGKTIVKEWLNQLLEKDHHIVRSPRSYNSQVGVPLSVWGINEKHDLGIFEAGISTINEMDKLSNIIQPTIGILTNIGEAHNEGFASKEEKLTEKIKLFKSATTIICNEGYTQTIAAHCAGQLFTWGYGANATISISSIEIQNKTAVVTFTYKEEKHVVTIPFVDTASIENVLTCISTLLALGMDTTSILQRIPLLNPIEMRLQLIKGINGCNILNDSYSNDLASLTIALDYLQQQAGNQTITVILSDVLESGIEPYILYQQIATELAQRNVQRFIGIGEQLYLHQSLFSTNSLHADFYLSTEDYLNSIVKYSFDNASILLKGARVYAFERIAKLLELKVHQTVMEINLSALIHNLNQYQQHLLPTTKVMAMVKAFSYGSGSAEIAQTLAYHKVDYLAVAYPDEGIELRKAGVRLPIMVLNTDKEGFDALINYQLEPELYSFSILEAFNQYLQNQGLTQYPVHIKLNTGMNRLGFEPTDVAALSHRLSAQQTMVVKSIFSHLVASEQLEHDAFTQHQAQLFEQFSSKLEAALGYSTLWHIANTAAIFRHPKLQYNMVRVGIGLYGVDSGGSTAIQLQTVAALYATIAQIRWVEAGETVGYNRRGQIKERSRIATIRIGYADGFSRRLGNGIGAVYIQGKLAPIIGSVCMDMTMIDITHIPNVAEGDRVEIFGNYLSIETVAKLAQTIAYEVLSTISQRVKRVYLKD